MEPLSGTPAMEFFIEPYGARIGLRIRADVGDMPVPTLTELSLVRLGRGSKTVIELSISRKDLYRDFYALACLVADRTQLEDFAIGDALTDTLASWNSLL